MKHELSEREQAAARRLIEFLQAILDGEDVQLTNYGKDEDYDWQSRCVADFYAHGRDFRIIEPPKRRPWTREEAEAHFGWILVDPLDAKSMITCVSSDTVHWPHAMNPTFGRLLAEGWKVHLAGQPNTMKPASAEVT